MPTTNLRKVGGSIMLAVPPALLELLQLRPGAKVEVTAKKGRLVIAPQRKPHYTLNELLAQCNPQARRSRQDRTWLANRPTGGELI